MKEGNTTFNKRRQKLCHICKKNLVIIMIMAKSIIKFQITVITVENKRVQHIIPVTLDKKTTKEIPVILQNRLNYDEQENLKASLNV